jgi:hypothetical protein
MRIGAWMTSPSRGLGDRVTLCRPRGSRAVGQSVVASFHAVTGQFQVLVGIIVDVVQMVH